MEGCTEIRWHARGGQGAVTAAKFLAEAALAGGRDIQAFPEYGPERMGAPIKAFTRISTSPIGIYCAIENPSIVVVLDETLLDTVKVHEGLTNDGVILVNSSKSPEMIRNKIGVKTGKIFTVPATAIALETLGKPIPNTPMIGALIKITGIISLEEILEHFALAFGKKFGQKILDGNVAAIKRAYEEVVAE